MTSNEVYKNIIKKFFFTVAEKERCEHGFTYYDGCNTCFCDQTVCGWMCTALWCGGITTKPAPCLCK